MKLHYPARGGGGPPPPPPPPPPPTPPPPPPNPPRGGRPRPEQANSRLSTTHDHITDCKLDSVVCAGVCLVVYCGLLLFRPNDRRPTVFGGLGWMAEVHINVSFISALVTQRYPVYVLICTRVPQSKISFILDLPSTVFELHDILRQMHWMTINDGVQWWSTVPQICVTTAPDTYISVRFALRPTVPFLKIANAPNDPRTTLTVKMSCVHETVTLEGNLWSVFLRDHPFSSDLTFIMLHDLLECKIEKNVAEI